MPALACCQRLIFQSDALCATSGTPLALSAFKAFGDRKLTRSSMVTNPVSQAPAIGIGLGSIGEVALALAIVLVAIFAVAWLVRRLHGGSIGAAGHLRVLSVMSVGPRERLLLVDVAGQQLLLGVTATQISSLHAFAEPVVPQSEAGAGEFTQRLRQALGRGQAG